MRIKCTVCGIDKEEKHFYHRIERGGLRSKICKKCTLELAKDKKDKKRKENIYAF